MIIARNQWLNNNGVDLELLSNSHNVELFQDVSLADLSDMSDISPTSAATSPPKGTQTRTVFTYKCIPC